MRRAPKRYNEVMEMGAAQSMALPQITRRERVYEGVRVGLERLIVRTADGREALREVVRHPGAVVVLPLTDDGDVVFVRNVRVAVGGELLELPAGTLEPGEPPEACAARELAEETGWRAGSLEKLGEFYTSPGVLDEKIVAYVATGLSPGSADPDAGEQVAPLGVPYDQAVAMCADGRVRDGKTIAAVLMHAVRSRREGRP